MFNFLGGLGGFMSSLPNLAGLANFAGGQVPRLNDYSNLNTYFRTALGPSGLLGVGDPNIAASITGSINGTLGAGASQDLTARVPQYRTVYDRVPVYADDHYKAFDYEFEQGSINQHTTSSSTFTPVRRDPVIINFDGTGTLGVTGTDDSHETIADATTVTSQTDGSGTTTTTTRNWTTRDNWKNKIDFDVNGDGKVDRTEWLKSGTKDAFLVMDVNNDGKIDGKELMNETGIDGTQNKYKTGWDKARDVADKNRDGILEGDELKNLKVWNDANGDGKVDTGEMKSLADAGVVSINTLTGDVTRKRLTGYKAVPRQEVAGYFEFNSFASSTSSSNGFSFLPTGGGVAAIDMLTGQGAMPSPESFAGLDSYLAATRPPMVLPDGTVVPDTFDTNNGSSNGSNNGSRIYPV